MIEYCLGGSVVNNSIFYNKIMGKIILLCVWILLFFERPHTTTFTIILILLAIPTFMETINLIVYWAYWRVGCRDITQFTPVIHTGSSLLRLLGFIMSCFGESSTTNNSRNLTCDERIKLENTVREVQRLQKSNPYYVDQNRGNRNR